MSAADVTPLPTRFFPVARLGLVMGVLVGVMGFVEVKLRPLPPPPAVVEPPPKRALLAERPPDPAPAPPPPQSVLHGPAGTPVDVPLHGPLVAHVWLEGCADCMPAFDAMRNGMRDALQRFPVVNISYGRASDTFPAKYAVDDHLVWDVTGSAVVRPLGIGSFTTLVIDRKGNVLLRDRPDHAGYLDRVTEAFGRAETSE